MFDVYARILSKDVRDYLRENYELSFEERVQLVRTAYQSIEEMIAADEDIWENVTEVEKWEVTRDGLRELITFCLDSLDGKACVTSTYLDDDRYQDIELCSDFRVMDWLHYAEPQNLPQDQKFLGELAGYFKNLRRQGPEAVEVPFFEIFAGKGRDIKPFHRIPVTFQEFFLTRHTYVVNRHMAVIYSYHQRCTLTTT